MKALLYVRGDKDPIELEEAEAKAAEALIGDASRTPDTAFSIQGVWTGKKADMKFVKFPKVEPKYEDWKIEPMTKAEAEAFEQEIEQDKVKAGEVYGRNKDGELRTYNWQGLYMHRMGALKLEVVDVDGRKVDKVLSRDTILWGNLDKKIRSYVEFTIKRDYSKAQEAKVLETMAKEQGL